MKGNTFPLLFLLLLVAFAGIVVRIAMPIVASLTDSSAVDPASPVLFALIAGAGGVLGLILHRDRVFTNPRKISHFRPMAVGLMVGTLVGSLCSLPIWIPGLFIPLANLLWILLMVGLLAAGTIFLDRWQMTRRNHEPIVDLEIDDSDQIRSH